jgi:hypothetical protein
LRLWEFSPVTFAANEKARITSAKSLSELLYDINGDPVQPKDGDPFFANLTWGGNEANTWTLIAGPNMPSNQFIIQVVAYYTSIRYIGAKINDYNEAMEIYRDNYYNSWSLTVYQIPWVPTGRGVYDIIWSTIYRPPFFGPKLTDYLDKIQTGGGNRLISGSLVRKSDGSFAIRLNNIMLG